MKRKFLLILPILPNSLVRPALTLIMALSKAFHDYRSETAGYLMRALKKFPRFPMLASEMSSQNYPGWE